MTSVEVPELTVDHAAPSLTVRVGSETATVAPTEAPVVIGREDPSAAAAQQPRIRIADGRISRRHLVVDHRGDQWFGVPEGRNGAFIRGEQVSGEFLIPDDGLEVTLGSPVGGIKVHFSTLDPAMVYVGAQVAKRRLELDVSQRTLASQNIVNAGALISFEKGRSWPRPKTRQKLEEVLRWPEGTIEKMRRDYVTSATAAPDAEGERTELIAPVVGDTTTVGSSFMAQTVAIALGSMQAQVQALPAPTAPDFGVRVGSLLAELRQLESLASQAANSARGAADIFRQLSAVRQLYREVMMRAASSPHATLGQRVFAARHRAELSVEEAAAMVAVSADDVRAAESDAPLGEPQQAALQRLLAAL